MPKKTKLTTFVFEDFLVSQGGKNPDLSFVVKGGAFPAKERPRMSSATRGRKKKTWMYNPSALADRAFQAALYKALKDCGVSRFPFFAPEETNNKTSKGLILEVDFYINRIKSDFKKVKGVEQLKDNCQQFTTRKDTDNMLKFLMDTFNNIVYDDDRCVVKLYAGKHLLNTTEKAASYATIRIRKI
jgi:Holliday junction resolvase RusA-like endonuclease